MTYRRYRTNCSGFMATAQREDRLPIHQSGEVWAPGQWSVDWHTNPGWELYFQAKGESCWDVGSTRMKVPEGGAYLIREGTCHRLREMSEGGVHFFWMVFPDKVVPRAVRGADCWRSSHLMLANAHALLAPFQGIIRETAIKEQWQAEVCRCYVDVACTEVVRLAENHQPERPWAGHPGAERARRLMVSRLEHPWRLEELARLSGLSPQYLISVYREDYGETPMRALANLRLEEARRRLLETAGQVTEIALELGFSSSQHFARMFRARFGMTPTEAREER